MGAKPANALRYLSTGWRKGFPTYFALTLYRLFGKRLALTFIGAILLALTGIFFATFLTYF